MSMIFFKIICVGFAQKTNVLRIRFKTFGRLVIAAVEFYAEFQFFEESRVATLWLFSTNYTTSQPHSRIAT